MTRMIKAVIFDLDGVIADSMPLHFEAEKRTLTGYGVKATDNELHINTQGNKLKVKFTALLEANGVNADVDEVLREHSGSGHRYITAHVEPVPGFMELSNNLKGRYKLGVVSGNGKPYPEGFLACSSELGVRPAEFVVFIGS